ncbi:hypothetical protein Leryth_005417 [Lithospermum erythrorhizon]|nr:hypothetical protein Leryth_005417 [Lithospermum erythrorhizon]
MQSQRPQLVVAEGEKDQALGEIKKMQGPKVADMKLSEVNELNKEVGSLKGLLSNSKDELKQKDGKIKSLEIKLENVSKLESELESRDSLVARLKQELNNVKESKSPVSVLSADNKRSIVELEAEVERGAISELKMLDSLKQQTKLLEETKIELEETKLELVSLQKNVDTRDVDESRDKENIVQSRDEDGSLKTELLLARDQLAQALDNERIALMKTKSLQNEIALVKNELGLLNDELNKSISAEETSKKAMDELAIALKEVSKVSNLEKEKHQTILLELEHVKEESEQLKEMIRSTEERYQQLLDEAEKETEAFRNTADRLRLEAEESLLAWNGKEMGFVTCIKKVEEEKAVVEQENAKFAEALKETETLSRSAREENYKLRDILKQAINEANVAKLAARIASDENSVLKDSISERDEELLMLNKENERLRVNEDSANENVKEDEEENGGNEKITAKLKSIDEHDVEDETEEEENEETTAKLMSIVEHDVEDENEEEEENGKNEKTTSKLKSISDVEQDVEDENEEEEENGEKRASSFDLDETKDIDDQDSARNITKLEDHLKGSIFDSDCYPKSEPHTPISISNQQTNPLIRDEGTLHSEDHGNVDSHHQYDSDGGRNNSRTKKKLFRRVSDIIMRKKMIPSRSMGSQRPIQM